MDKYIKEIARRMKVSQVPDTRHSICYWEADWIGYTSLDIRPQQLDDA